MRRLAFAIAILALVGCAHDAGDASGPTPSPVTSSPASQALSSPTPCRPDPLDETPCPGTPKPAIEGPLPPPGPIANEAIDSHLPASLTASQHALVKKVMLAWRPDQRQDIRWIRCGKDLFVFNRTLGAYSGQSKTIFAAQELNDDPHPHGEGGGMVTLGTCVQWATM